MIGTWFWAGLWPPFVGLGVPWIMSRITGQPRRPVYWLWLVIDTAGVAADLLPPVHWVRLAVHLTSATVAAYLWWRSRRPRRKRAPRALGAKSWARLARLVQGLRDALRPRRVWQPQPGGAGW